jgi:hypothetical protein
MRRRRFPQVTFALAAVALAISAISFGEHQFAATRSSGLDGGWVVQLGRGRVTASRSHLLSSVLSRPAAPTWRNAGGFSWERRVFGPGGIVGGKVMSQHVAVPTYPLPLAAGALLAWRLRRWYHGPTSGRCAACGYDLRASPDRCPECGTRPALG